MTILIGMTLGNVIYSDYLKDILVDTYSIYYKEFKHASDTDQVDSIIHAIDEKYKILLYHEPDATHNKLLDLINIGEKESTIKSLNISNYLTYLYKDTHFNNLFTITLFFRHNTLCNYLNVANKYEYKLHHYISLYEILEELKDEVHFHYGMLLLHKKRYNESGKYIIYMNPVRVDRLNIAPNTMSFFKDSDTAKTLLVYMSGGIGDNIMHSRFIRKVCDTFKKNKIIFLVYDSLVWIYSHIYKHINNLVIIPFHNRNQLPNYDYHINVSLLYNSLNIEYKDIYIEYFSGLPSHELSSYKPISRDKPNIIINWKGCGGNSHEQYNRGIPLNLLIPLLKMKHINWICITKHITDEEMIILNENGVSYLGLDTTESFRHSTTLLNHVDCVITTDTSLAHMCGTLGVMCYTLLTAGCDWRWTRDKTTNWYPKMNLIRQTTQFEWANVISELINVIKTMVNG